MLTPSGKVVQMTIVLMQRPRRRLIKDICAWMPCCGLFDSDLVPVPSCSSVHIAAQLLTSWLLSVGTVVSLHVSAVASVEKDRRGSALAGLNASRF